MNARGHRTALVASSEAQVINPLPAMREPRHGSI